jgi:hypothetical protein
MSTCPICEQPADIRPYDDRDGYRVHCVTCGRYAISDTAFHFLPRNLEYQGKKHILSGILRDHSEHGNPFTILTTNIPDLLSSASIPDGPFEAIDRLLLYIHRHARTAASYVEIKPTDYSLVYAKDSDEFGFYLTRAAGLGYIENPGGNQYRLTLEGWKRLDELRKRAIKSNQAFVAMWFSEEMKSVWSDGFFPALDITGYHPIRMDLLEHNDKIDDRIVAEIRRSGLLVADFRGIGGMSISKPVSP